MTPISIWWRAVRPFSFTVSVIPPILGALIALLENPNLQFKWVHFFLTLIGCVMAHAGANLLSDYFDYKIGVDREGTFGSSGLLVEDTLEARRHPSLSHLSAVGALGDNAAAGLLLRRAAVP